METHRLTGEVTINFDTYFRGDEKGVLDFINKFNEFALQFNNLDLKVDDGECRTRVLDHDFKWLTIEDENGEIQVVDEDLLVNEKDTK